ncbi:P-loop containing nucleoside triphosphate hydrolase protein [Xylariaceae sp. FL1019]|nr:P-loop containing nucleoside triphosphate hydrolase protein [Xylariaceae sp. FL1019]
MAPDDLLRQLDQMLQKGDQSSGTVDPFVDTLNVLTGGESRALESRPMVRDCNWEQFKNRFESVIPAIEVLLGHEDLNEQIEAEQLKRVDQDQRTGFDPTRRKSVSVISPIITRSTSSISSRRQEVTPIDRVRINSPIILGYLSKVTGAGPWVGTPHTFLAPFRTLTHFHEQMEQETKNLRATLRHEVQPASGAETADDPFAFLRDSELQLMMRSRKAYEELNCYVNFINTRILPHFNMYSKETLSRPSRIRYRDLPSMFRVGELVVEPGVISKADKRNSRLRVAEPKLWRLCYVSEDTPDWAVDNLDVPGGKLRGQMGVNAESTHLRLYYIDFDGYRYTAVRSDASIKSFDGEKEITKLPFYPLRFHKDSQRLLKELQERGQRFHEITSAGNTTLTYQGLTLAKDPTGRDIPAKTGRDVPSWPEYVESEVIVDFHEAFQLHPWWKPDFQQFPAPETYAPATIRDEFDILNWADPHRRRMMSTIEETIVEYHAVEELEWADLMKKDPFILQDDEDSRPLDHMSQKLSACDLALLPSRLFVYSLRNRSFINADIRFLKTKPEIQNPLESLQLPEKLKTMIQSSVFGHLEKKKVQRRATLVNIDFMDQDIIRGKGQGLAILLHGPPGVGKTATAEAVAHFYNKPLFTITAGDLGTDPWDVESNLAEIFRLANLWDCILLLDEAETLLAQREKKDDNATKSSIVSGKPSLFAAIALPSDTDFCPVFLRTLEYYPGILFLTTNRPGIMDEAVKSRMQVSLQYPRLGLVETMAIFRTNLDRLMDIEFERSKITGEATLEVKSDQILAFAAAHFQRHEGSTISPPWNGRQIRNAFQIAPSIARYEHAHRTQQFDEGPYIGPEHFEKVEETTVEPETNQQVVYRTTDEEAARRREERERGQSPPNSVHSAPRCSPTRAVIPRRMLSSRQSQSGDGLRSPRNSGESQQRKRFSGEFHMRHRSSSSVMPLYLPSAQQFEEKSFLREPSPPYTPELSSVPDNRSAERE